MTGLFYCGNQWGYTPVGRNANIPTVNCLPPLNLQRSVQGEYVNFSWQAPHDYLRFILEYRVVGAPGWTAVPVQGINYKAKLAGSTSYEWRVTTVCSEILSSIPANGTNVTTQVAFPVCTPVSSVTVTNMGTFYRLSWASTGAQYYDVFWFAKVGPRPALFNDSTQNTYYDLKDLTPDVTYEAFVTAHCADPNLPVLDSPTVTFETGSLSCQKPTNLNATANSTAITVAWMGPGVSKYNIYLNGTLVVADYQQTSFNFTGLTPNTDYTIEIRTSCETGFSEPAALTVKTKPAVCPAPTGLNITGITPTGFTANWTPAPGISSQQLILDNGTPIVLGSGVNTYPFTNLPSGSNHVVAIRSVCPGAASTSLTTNVQLVGCAPVTNLVVDTYPTHLNIKWSAVANAVEYLVTVTRNSDSQVVFTGTATIGKITASGLEVSTAYTVSVTARCGVPGSNLTNSTAVTQVVSTTGANTCENANITAQAVGQNTASFTFNFASGRTTGNIKAVVRKQSDNSLISTQNISTVGTVIFTGLLAATQYKLFIYNEVTEEGVNCSPVQLILFTTTAVCAPPTNLTATLQTNDTEILVNATASVSTPPDYEIQLQLFGGNWVSKGNHTFPYTITGITPGRYKVRVKSNCVGSSSDWVESGWICTAPQVLNVAVNQNSVTILWAPIPGVTNYSVELRTLSGGTASYSTSQTSMTIADLAWNTNFLGTVKGTCTDLPNVEVTSGSFSFATGDQVTVPDPTLCPPAEFTAYIQDCKVTDPKNDEHPDGDPPPTDPGGTGCTLAGMDWAVVSSVFTNVVLGPNDAFMELTLSYQQTVGSGVTALMPGGVLAVVSTDCRPASTLNMPFEIVQGGTYITGDLIVATDGTVTASGSYESDGTGTLIIRGRANYIKA